MYSGYQFKIDEKRDIKVQPFGSLSHHCHLFLLSSCYNCFETIQLNPAIFRLNDKQSLVSAGLTEWKDPLPIRGYTAFAGGPSFCQQCLLLWRQGGGRLAPPDRTEISFL